MNDFIKRLQAHSVAAQQRWHKHMEDKRVSRAVWNQVLVEEVGKLSRACNKLEIAVDPDVRSQWEREAKHKLITIASVCMRFNAAFDDCRPDTERPGGMSELAAWIDQDT